MSKSTFFTGQPIFNQLLSLIPRQIIQDSVRKFETDRYYKKFKSYDHLVTLLYACFQKCTSLREVVTGMMACQHKLAHLGLKAPTRRSTLSEAMNRRNHEFFSSVYHRLYQLHFDFSPDSRIGGKIEDRLFLLDSTTIRLFSEIMKGMGSRPVDGKKKGGAKAHMLVKSSDDLPVFTLLTHATKNDKEIFKHLNLPKGAIIVFDKGYNSYEQFEKWDKESVTWVTRMSDVAWQETIEHRTVTTRESKAGILSDDIVKLGRPSNEGSTKRITVRRITFDDKINGRVFTFITNNKTFKASTIAGIYKRRWQIELLFKRLKQNYPLKYFLGESENAIKSQIWCSLITDLLLAIIKKNVKKQWSFSNIAGMVRLHLMNYIDIYAFLSDPEKSLINYSESEPSLQLNLFNTS